METKVLVVIVHAVIGLMGFSILVATFESGGTLVSASSEATKTKDQTTSDSDGGKTNLFQNPQWNDSKESCQTTFDCNFNAPDGWQDRQSIKLSTQNNSFGVWSWIFSQDVSVSPNSDYELVTHMKMNNWTTQSHVALQALNESSKEYYQILQCPHGMDGLLAWHEFSCAVKIPHAVHKVSLVLNAGWSSREGEPAITLFDAMQLRQKPAAK